LYLITRRVRLSSNRESLYQWQTSQFDWHLS